MDTAVAGDEDDDDSMDDDIEDDFQRGAQRTSSVSSIETANPRPRKVQIDVEPDPYQITPETDDDSEFTALAEWKKDYLGPDSDEEEFAL